jgi:hypothetical protein
MLKATVAFLLIAGLLVAPAHADTVTVTAMGQVIFNGISDPPLSGVPGGDLATMSFVVDSNNFVDGIPGDTRGYVIDPTSFSLSFASGVSLGLLAGPDTAYFTLVDGFPVSDGFFVSTSPVSPGGVPLEQAPFNANLDLGYDGSTLASLDILDAVGVYGFGGLTRFAFNIWAIFPDNVALDMDFISLTIEAAVSVEASSWSRVKATYR